MYEILGGTLMISQNATMSMCWAWFGIYYVLCSKHIAHLVVLFWFPAGSRRAARGTRICETPLLYISTPWKLHSKNWTYIKTLLTFDIFINANCIKKVLRAVQYAQDSINPSSDRHRWDISPTFRVGSMSNQRRSEASIKAFIARPFEDIGKPHQAHTHTRLISLAQSLQIMFLLWYLP